MDNNNRYILNIKPRKNNDAVLCKCTLMNHGSVIGTRLCTLENLSREFGRNLGVDIHKGILYPSDCTGQSLISLLGLNGVRIEIDPDDDPEDELDRQMRHLYGGPTSLIPVTI